MMRGILLAAGLLAFGGIVLAEMAGTKTSTAPFWIVSAICLSAFAVCDYLHHILHALTYIARKQRREDD